MPSVGVGYIGAYLKEQGLDVRIIDAQFTKEDPTFLLETTPPTLVAIGVDSRTIYRGLTIAQLAKAYGHTTLLGGLHVSLIKTDILEFPEVDFGIVGDGEVATYQLIQALEGKRDIGKVSGLIYRGDGGVRLSNPNVTETIELDTLPFPDYRLAGIQQFPLYPLVTSRDCPYKCTYCTVGNISHGRFRARSPISCVDEILIAKERYGIRGFIVVDENFSFKIDRVIEFCQLLIDHNVNLPWTVFEGLRADCLDDSLLKLLKASGCRWIFFGIESAENAILRTVRKGEKIAQVEKAIHLARQHEFRVGGFFIIGLPTSSFEQDMLSVQWALKNLDKASFWMSIPYYGTALFDWVRNNARFLREPVGDNVVNTLSTMPFYDTPDYPELEIKRAHVIASLRTGVNYFYEYLDKKGSNTPQGKQQEDSEYKQKIIEVLRRYDPVLLDHFLIEGSLENPPSLTSKELSEMLVTDPLPGDMLGGMINIDVE